MRGPSGRTPLLSFGSPVGILFLVAIAPVALVMDRWRTYCFMREQQKERR